MIFVSFRNLFVVVSGDASRVRARIYNIFIYLPSVGNYDTNSFTLLSFIGFL
nr:MAG TPA: hypothetical protein [Caudoviricetes sp.]